MINIIKDGKYWSKAKAFLVPLTGLKKHAAFPREAYLFWKNYSVDSFNLIITYEVHNEEAFDSYCKKEVFPVLDSKGYLSECYKVANLHIFVLDLSEWSMDIEMLLDGKYSKFTKQAKEIIEKFHRDPKNNALPTHIYPVLYPTLKMDVLKENGKEQSPIEYVAKHYGLPLDEMMKVGEIGSKIVPEQETLSVETCQIPSDTVEA